VTSLGLISPTGFGRRQPPQGPATERILKVLRLLLGPNLFRVLTTRPSIRYFLRQSFAGPVPPELVDYAGLTARQPGAHFAPFRFLSMKLFTPNAFERLYRAARTAGPGPARQGSQHHLRTPGRRRGQPELAHPARSAEPRVAALGKARGHDGRAGRFLGGVRLSTGAGLSPLRHPVWRTLGTVEQSPGRIGPAGDSAGSRSGGRREHVPDELHLVLRQWYRCRLHRCLCRGRSRRWGRRLRSGRGRLRRDRGLRSPARQAPALRTGCRATWPAR
jgi:hypothetical protein